MEVLAAAIHWGSKDFHAMSGKSKPRRAASATPWDNMPEEPLSPAQALASASHKSMYASRHERFDGDADFFNGHPLSEYPFRGGEARKNGLNRSGAQRCLCRACGMMPTPVAGTVFDSSKLPLPAWTDFPLQAFSYASATLMTREDRRADTACRTGCKSRSACSEACETMRLLTWKPPATSWFGS